jgi:peptidoglycan-N-acetylmuramic acid deacetylase
LFAFSLVKDGNAYGFGVKKNDKNIQPDIGFYKSILEENNAIYVGNKNSKKIYLTFDCGYENGFTERILDVLENQNVPAVFFVTGHYITSAPNLVLRMKEDGHAIGNHSNKHKDITKISEEEIKKEVVELESMYTKLTGSNIDPFYRPPEGSFDGKSLATIKKLGYTTLFWSLAYKDWEKDVV